MDAASLVEQACKLLKEDGLPVYFDQRSSTCTIRKAGGVVITEADGDLIVRNNNRDTLFVLQSPNEVKGAFDLYHGEYVVRVKGKNGVVEFRYPSVGDKRLKVVLAVDVDSDNDIDMGAVRVWK